jgi:hypothetical protein
MTWLRKDRNAGQARVLHGESVSPGGRLPGPAWEFHRREGRGGDDMRHGRSWGAIAWESPSELHRVAWWSVGTGGLVPRQFHLGGGDRDPVTTGTVCTVRILIPYVCTVPYLQYSMHALAPTANMMMG